jgi:hypothetical protein
MNVKKDWKALLRWGRKKTLKRRENRIISNGKHQERL